MTYEVEVTNVTTGEKLNAVIEETKPCQMCEGTGWDGGEVGRGARRDCDDCLACGGTGAELPEVC